MAEMGVAVSETGGRTFEEELGWKEIDQLGAATAQFSDHCLEYKKLCVALITAVPALLMKLTNNKLDPSIFVAAGLIAITFWIIDAQAYFYQEKLRDRMKEIAQKLQQARGEKTLVDGVGLPISNRTAKKRRFRSYFNSSQLPYYILFAVDGSLWVAYAFHWIA